MDQVFLSQFLEFMQVRVKGDRFFLPIGVGIENVREIEVVVAVILCIFLGSDEVPPLDEAGRQKER